MRPRWIDDDLMLHGPGRGYGDPNTVYHEYDPPFDHIHCMDGTPKRAPQSCGGNCPTGEIINWDVSSCPGCAEGQVGRPPDCRDPDPDPDPDDPDPPDGGTTTTPPVDDDDDPTNDQNTGPTVYRDPRTGQTVTVQPGAESAIPPGYERVGSVESPPVDDEDDDDDEAEREREQESEPTQAPVITDDDTRDYYTSIPGRVAQVAPEYTAAVQEAVDRVLSATSADEARAANAELEELLEEVADSSRQRWAQGRRQQRAAFLAQLRASGLPADVQRQLERSFDLNLNLLDQGRLTLEQARENLDSEIQAAVDANPALTTTTTTTTATRVVEPTPEEVAARRAEVDAGVTAQAQRLVDGEDTLGDLPPADRAYYESIIAYHAYTGALPTFDREQDQATLNAERDRRQAEQANDLSPSYRTEAAPAAPGTFEQGADDFLIDPYSQDRLPLITDQGVYWDSGRQLWVHPSGAAWRQPTVLVDDPRYHAPSERLPRAATVSGDDDPVPEYRTVEGVSMIPSDGSFPDPYRVVPGGSEFTTAPRPQEPAGIADDIAAVDMGTIDPRAGYRPVGPDPSPRGDRPGFVSTAEMGPAVVEYERIPGTIPDSGGGDSPPRPKLLRPQLGGERGEIGGLPALSGRQVPFASIEVGPSAAPVAPEGVDIGGGARELFGRAGGELQEFLSPLTDPVADWYRREYIDKRPTKQPDDYFDQTAYSYIGMTGGFVLGNRNIETIEEEANFRRDNADAINLAMSRMHAVENRNEALQKIRELGPDAKTESGDRWVDVAAYWQHHADTTDLSSVSPEAAEYAQKLSSQQGFRLPSVPTPIGALSIPTPTNALNTLIEHQQSGDFRISEDEYGTIPQRQYQDALDSALLAINLYSVPALTYRTAQGVVSRRLLTPDGVRNMARQLPRNLREEIIEDGAIQIAYIPAGGGLQPGLLDLIELPTEASWEAAAEARGRRHQRLFVAPGRGGDPAGYELDGDRLQEVDLETFERTGDSIPVSGVSLARPGTNPPQYSPYVGNRVRMVEQRFTVPDYVTVGATAQADASPPQMSDLFSHIGVPVMTPERPLQQDRSTEVEQLLSRPTVEPTAPTLPVRPFGMPGSGAVTPPDIDIGQEGVDPAPLVNVEDYYGITEAAVAPVVPEPRPEPIKTPAIEDYYGLTDSPTFETETEPEFDNQFFVEPQRRRSVLPGFGDQTETEQEQTLTDAQVGFQTQTQTQTQVEADADTNTLVETETDTLVDTEVETEIVQEPETEVEVETVQQRLAQLQNRLQTETLTETETLAVQRQLDAMLELELAPELLELALELRLDTQTQPGEATDTDTDTTDVPDPVRPRETETDTKLDIRSRTETETELDLERANREIRERLRLGEWPDEVEFATLATTRLNLHSGAAVSHLEDLGAVDLDFSDLPLEPDRGLAARNLNIEIDRAGVAHISPQWRRQHIVHERGSDHKNGRSSRPRGGQEFRQVRRRR